MALLDRVRLAGQRARAPERDRARAVARWRTRRSQPALLGLEACRRVASRAAPQRPTVGNEGFRDAKERLIAAWERDYVTQLLRRAGGNVSKAAREGGLDRVYLHRLIKKYNIANIDE